MELRSRILYLLSWRRNRTGWQEKIRALQLLVCRREASWPVEARAEPGVTDRSWMGRKKWQGVGLEHQKQQRHSGCTEYEAA